MEYETDTAEDEEDEDDQEDDEDNDWSGHDDNIEAVIHEVLQGNREMAAYLIPILHQGLVSRLTTNLSQKVEPWCQGVNTAAGAGAAPSDQRSPSNTSASDSASNNRKRKRPFVSKNRPRDADEDEDDEEEEDDEKRGPNEIGSPSDVDVLVIPRLACPFHKKDPTKYGPQNGAVEGSRKVDYRICAGPGFKNEQRLKYVTIK